MAEPVIDAAKTVRPAAPSRWPNTSHDCAASVGGHTCRLLADGPGDGAWNMGVDEVLLESAARGDGPTLRLYQWEAATLSLGYFQSFHDARQHLRVHSVPIVRRLTGGGAILHHHELTYSLAVHQGHPLAADAAALYARVHSMIAEVLNRLGITATVRGNSTSRTGPLSGGTSVSPLSAAHGRTFFCFQRRSDDDLMVEGRKVAGSAQRRRRGGVLQHGSLIVAPSEYLEGVGGLGRRDASELLPSTLVPLVAEAVGDNLGMEMLPSRLCGQEARRAASLVASKYGNAGWTRRR